MNRTLGPLDSLRPVLGGGAQGAEVWHAMLASGEQCAVKRHEHAGAGEVEFGVLQMLFNLGAPVVRPLQWDPQVRILVTEWAGNRTLATAMHEAPKSQSAQARQLSPLAQRLVRGCTALETAFAGLSERLLLRTQGEQQRRHAEARERCRRAAETYARIAAFFNLTVPRSWTSSLQKAWLRVAESICAGGLTLGGRDCTPRNVLTDGTALWFLDFAVVGLDWPEARLAQYAAATAATADNRQPASLLTHGEEQWYVDSGCIESAQLDMHHLLLWSEAARLLLDGKLGKHSSQGSIPGQRLRQVLELARSPLASQTPAEPVRALLATVFENGLPESH